MRHRPWLFAVLIVSLLVLLTAGCSREEAPPETTSSDGSTVSGTETNASDSTANESNVDAAAYVNDLPILSEDFERGKQQLLARYQQIYAQIGLETGDLLGGAEGRLFELRIEEEALEMATARVLIADELSHRGASVSDTAVEEVFQVQYSQFLTSASMTEEELKQAFEEGELSGVPTGDVSFDQFIASTRQTSREELELQALRRLIAGEIAPSEAVLRAYFQEHSTEYAITEKVRLSQILVATRETAEQALAVLDAGGRFADLAKEISVDSDSSMQGGDIGWLERGMATEAFDDAAFGTPMGGISEIIPTEYGFHILTPTDYMSARQPEFGEVADRVADDYAADLEAQRFEDWYESARDAAEIVILDPILSAYRKQIEDVDEGLQAFETLLDEGQIDEPYLGFIIGMIYETKMNEAASAREILLSYMTRTPSQEQELASLEIEMNANRNKAITAYYASLENFGSHLEIEARIDRLNPGF